MKKITFLLILLVLSSCKKESEPYFMYGLLIEQFVESNEILKSQITENLKNDKLIKN